MSERKDGGPAFPFKQRYADDVRQQAAASGRPLPEFISNSGMSLRDYFIAHAPAKEIEDITPRDVKGCAAYLDIPMKSYTTDHYLLVLAKARCQWADAMLAERDK